MHKAGMAVMKWPACSLDLNPMENMWSYLSHQVYACSKQCSSVKDLRETAHCEWNNVLQSHMDKFIFQWRKGV